MGIAWRGGFCGLWGGIEGGTECMPSFKAQEGCGIRALSGKGHLGCGQGPGECLQHSKPMCMCRTGSAIHRKAVKPYQT